MLRERKPAERAKAAKGLAEADLDYSIVEPTARVFFAELGLASFRFRLADFEFPFDVVLFWVSVWFDIHGCELPSVSEAFF